MSWHRMFLSTLVVTYEQNSAHWKEVFSGEVKELVKWLGAVTNACQVDLQQHAEKAFRSKFGTLIS